MKTLLLCLLFAQEKPPEKAKLVLTFEKGHVFESAVKYVQTYRQDLAPGKFIRSEYDVEGVLEITVDDASDRGLGTLSGAYKKLKARGTYANPPTYHATAFSWDERIPPDKTQGDPTGVFKQAVVGKRTVSMDTAGKLHNDAAFAAPGVINLFPRVLLALPMVLPGREVTVGETWEGPFDLNGVAGKAVHKLDRVERAVAYVSSKVSLADPKDKKSKADGAATMEFDLTKGLPSKAKLKVSIHVPAFKLDQDYDVTLKKR